MKPWYTSSKFWFCMLAAMAGYVQSMQGLPGSVTQLAGLAVTLLAMLGYTASRTVLEHQDSAEAHEIAVASIKVAIPDAKVTP